MSWLTVGRRWWERIQAWIGFLAFGDSVYDSLPGPQLPPSGLPPAPVARVPIPLSVPVCEVCGGPSTGLRSHDGHWRCAGHKGVTCDVCARAIPADPLPDPSWLCVTHRSA